ncbi:copper amine oxidase N-terminal domain-containing protein [Paenibacillus sp. 598K]|uniref:copper amine oxidase N-terminal domain-containing protein n=1 Tax=Paenibacillus sp. 598K TaxID=1117987 RepID=UPI001625F417|nr:copper amine oxidase N-terminal domain-containing protein [Paenibacillus sp. 598K]
MKSWKVKAATAALTLTLVAPTAALAYVPEDAALVGVGERDILLAGLAVQRANGPLPTESKLTEESRLHEPGEHSSLHDPVAEPSLHDPMEPRPSEEPSLHEPVESQPSEEPSLHEPMESHPAMVVEMALGSELLTINGQQVTMDIVPVVHKGATYIPLRYLAEALGAEVGWDQEARVTILQVGEREARFWANRTFMELDGIQRHFATPILVQDGRTLVPVRFIAELFGWQVAFSERGGTITLTLTQ